jgi:hypothetical protein
MYNRCGWEVLAMVLNSQELWCGSGVPLVQKEGEGQNSLTLYWIQSKLGTLYTVGPNRYS